jgi:hypothetical protein
VGDIVVQITTAGFAVNANGFTAVAASVPPYVRQRKLSTWPDFLSKFEQHAKWSFAKSTAQTLSARFKAKLGIKPGKKTNNPEEQAKATLLLGRR